MRHSQAERQGILVAIAMNGIKKIKMDVSTTVGNSLGMATVKIITTVYLITAFTGMLWSQQGIYSIHKITSEIKVDGKLDHTWNYANTLSNFHYPWRNDSVPSTSFKALYNDTHIFFLFYAADEQIILKKDGQGEMDALYSDRVEIFLKSSDDQPYYALEIDALGRVLDTKGKFGKKVDFDWHWPQGEIDIATQIDADGYWVEGSISFKSLKELGIYDGGSTIIAGLYRGEYLRTEKTETRWISWIIPNSAKPNFHIPSSFGHWRLIR